MRTLCILLICFFTLAHASGQSRIKTYGNRYSTQYGYSLKATLEFGRWNKPKPNPIFRIAASGGVGSNFIADWLYPSFNVDLQLYNGGMGSRNKKNFFHIFNLDIVTALTLTGGSGNNFKLGNEKKLADRRLPLYYFSNFSYPALQNPFNYSLSIGTNLIFTPWARDKPNQRIGFINGNFNRAQISYYNDGGIPIYGLYLGDRKDRYYTGGAVISYHGKAYTELNLIELSYQKYTGYTRNAFEVSNKLYLAYMDYKQETQQYYNKSLWTLNIANVNRGWGVHFRSYDVIRIDAQHWIHWGAFNAYHLVPYKWHAAIGGNYYRNVSKIGLR